MTSRWIAGLLIEAVVLVACGAGTGRSPTNDAVSNLTVFGAASLQDALEKVATAYGAGHAGTTLNMSTDSSATLEAQIEQGAPADVFLSADVANAQKLVDAGLTAGGAVPFATNELSLIVPAGNPAGITSPADLARPGVKIIAAGNAVPITRYALELVSNLGREPGYPAGFAAGYAANTVSREDNVKAIVAKIELGEGDAGIVYRTDARASTRVASIDLPTDAIVRATYAGVVVKASTKPGAAATFLAWLAGSDGQAILATFGFLPLS